MQMPRITLLLCVALLLSIATNCENAVKPDQDEDNCVIYFNSFESAADTAGGYGFGRVEFWTDPPPGGGNRSLFVSGGCLIPHFALNLVPVDEDRYLKLRCWGKDLAIGGVVSLEYFDKDSQWRSHIDIYVSDTVWTAYEAEDTLFCPAAQTVSLRFISGGIVSSAMLLDMVEVIQIE